jgi:RimJ/RimL family protein N-acetyltransferase
MKIRALDGCAYRGWGSAPALRCYSVVVPESTQNLLNWKPPALPSPVVLRGRYVTLEPLNPSHAEALWQAIQGQDQLWTWLAAGPYASTTEIIESLDRWREAEKAVLFAIIPADTKRASGWASLMRIESKHGVIEVGNVLFSPVLQRSRAATEAMYLMASHVFDTLGYRRYEWKCNALNAASQRAAERFGFTYEGIFRQHMVVRGRSRDTAWFSMLDHEWPDRKRAFEAWLDPANFDVQGKQKRSLTEIRDATA